MNESTTNQLVVDEVSMLDAIACENIEAVRSVKTIPSKVIIIGDSNRPSLIKLIMNKMNKQNTQKELINMTTNSNSLLQEAYAKFETFLEGVNPTILSEGAKEVLLTAPTKWTHFIEDALMKYAKDKVEDVEERTMFTRFFPELHEKIAVSTSLADFVEWLYAEEFSFIATNGSLELINGYSPRDDYEVLDLFVTKFFN
jgi:hypothetical protein